MPSTDPEPDLPKFRPRELGLRKLLGDLEADVMERIWQWPAGQAVTVREVHQQIQADRKLAYTTIMTVMGNLARKGLLVVETDQHAHRYRPARPREAFVRQAVGMILDGLLADFAEPALAHLAQLPAGGADELAEARRRLQAFRQQPPEPR